MSRDGRKKKQKTFHLGKIMGHIEIYPLQDTKQVVWKFNM
jgi:hypothetical protein